MLRHLSILGFSLWAGFLFCARCFGGDSVRAPKDLLGAYLRNGDYAYDWELERSARDSGCTIHRLRLTSQRWRDRVWKHRLSVIVPDRVSHPGVLLFLSGEGVGDSAPVRDGEPAEFWLASAARLAAGCEAVVALLGQVPNRSSADSLNAGAWIRRTLELAVEDGDDSWPLLFPMTKCVIRAMDAVTEFCAEMLGRKAGGFVVGGAAEQGWAVWLAASRDERISAISPWCADMLNAGRRGSVSSAQPPDDSPGDGYVAALLHGLSGTERGQSLVMSVDPYARADSLPMPKLVVSGAAASAREVSETAGCLDSLPGINRVRYLPGAGRDLSRDSAAFGALGTFFSMLLEDEEFPSCRYSARRKGDSLSIDLSFAPDRLVGAERWYAVSDTLDFGGSDWHAEPLALSGTGRTTVTVPFPSLGYAACYVDLIYRTARRSALPVLDPDFPFRRETGFLIRWPGTTGFLLFSASFFRRDRCLRFVGLWQVEGTCLCGRRSGSVPEP